MPGRTEEIKMFKLNGKLPIEIQFLIALIVIAFLAVPDCTADVRRTESGYEFSYEDPGAASVSIAGSFNGWNANADPMVRDEQGVWRLTLTLGAGKHEYKFVVNGSDWISDPNNPVMTGDYGNSGLEIDSEGEIVVSAGAPKFSNTLLSSRVALRGNFRATFSSESSVGGDPKFRLQRPEHEFNLDVNIKANETVMGSGRLQFDTSLGDIQETQGRLYSGHMDLLSSAFDLRAYYNEEFLSFDEPLELLGHQDLRGTMREEHLDYGRGTQGALVTMRGFGTDGVMLYTNTYDFDRFNDPSTYDNSDTDVMGARLTRELRDGGFQIGLSWLRTQNGWWVDFVSGTNHSAAIDSFRSATESESDWFEMGTVDQTFAGDVRFELPGRLRCWLEYALWDWNARWDVGNRERYEGSNLVNGAIDVPVGDDSGYRFKALLDHGWGDKMHWSLSHEAQRYDAMDAGELYVNFRRPAFVDLFLNRLEGINAVPDFSIEEFPALPERKNDISEFDLHMELEPFKVELEIDRQKMTRVYTAASGVSPDGPSTQTNELWRVAPGLSLELFGDGLLLAVDYEYIENDPEGLFFQSFPVSDTYDPALGVRFYNTRELVFSGRLSLTAQVAALWDVRRMSYWANEGQLAADDDVYTSPYVAIAYAPSKTVELRLGYHVNPTYYNDAPLEGRGNGRQVWRDLYTWEHGGSVFDAERALSDATMVTLMGVIRF
jgi:hypothetical protein